jgi:HD-GYP domain-containing protein (c-di-GMP phosphodiesterase class II)
VAAGSPVSFVREVRAVLQLKANPIPFLENPRLLAVGPDRLDAWDILDQFGQALSECQQPAEHVRLFLRAVRDGVDADAVFVCPGLGKDPVDFLGDGNFTPAWCQDFIKRVLQATPAGTGELVRSHWRDVPGASPADPHSVAMARLSKSRPTWVAALGMGPDRPLDAGDIKVLTLARRILINHRQQCRLNDRLKETLYGLIRCLTATLDAKDPYTCGHSERVARIATRLGQQMRLPGQVLSDIHLSGLLHDVGKIGIQDRVLQKPGKLTPEEYAHIQEHTLIGDRIVANIRQLDHLRPGVRSHHERFDGQGYPDGLAGAQIPLLARVLAVADACDAMMADRPYRRAFPPEQIDAVMSQGAGKQWDPEIIKHFLACRHELYPICQRGLGESVFVAVQHAMDAGAARMPPED